MAKAIASIPSKIPLWIKATKDFSQPRLKTFMKYAKVELVPPKPVEIPEIMEGFYKLLRSAKTGAWKNLTVKEASLNTFVGLEIIFWFYIGECIGKRHVIGYDV